MVSSEVSPWAKSGGLADVVAALPTALASLGYTVGVVVPRFLTAADAPARRVISSLPIPLPSGDQTIDIRELPLRDLPNSAGGGPGSVTFYFIDAPKLYGRTGLYGDQTGDYYPDNHIRFAVLAPWSRSLEVARRLFRTDIFHCHDWQSALLPVYPEKPAQLLTRASSAPAPCSPSTTWAIRACSKLPLSTISVSPLPSSSPAGSSSGAASISSRAASCTPTPSAPVSPTYAREIQTPEFGFGLDGVLRTRGAEVSGILNGVDYSRWNPETDLFIPVHFSASDLSGKRECKRQLLGEMGLPDAALDKPLLGIVSRFATQKGFDLLGDIARDLFREDVNLVALGNGEPVWEELFRDLAREFPGRIGLRIGYDDALAHRIEAGCDIFLMPSQYEPCGLNQIYSLRYGTIPVVRGHRGGLDDTIVDAGPKGNLPAGTGFKFADYNGKALLDTIRRACRAAQDRKVWTALHDAGHATGILLDGGRARILAVVS